MSIAIMTDVWRLDMEAHRKLILLSLADNANDGGSCWPTQKTIAARSSISERSLRDHLHVLVAEGYLSIVTLGNGRGKSTHYLINTERIKAEADALIKAAKAEDDAGKAEVGAGKAEAASRPIVNQPSDLSTITDDCAPAQELFTQVFGYPPSKLLASELDGVDATHPPQCIEWTFREVAAAPDPAWKLARWMFNQCASGLVLHGPREKKNGRPSVGTNAGGRIVRQGDGRHIGASQRVPGTGVDWDAEEREHAGIIAGAKVRTARAAPVEVGEDV